jgi:hypothetical protein
MPSIPNKSISLILTGTVSAKSSLEIFYSMKWESSMKALILILVTITATQSALADGLVLKGFSMKLPSSYVQKFVFSKSDDGYPTRTDSIEMKTPECSLWVIPDQDSNGYSTIEVQKGEGRNLTQIQMSQLGDDLKIYGFSGACGNTADGMSVEGLAVADRYINNGVETVKLHCGKAAVTPFSAWGGADMVLQVTAETRELLSVSYRGNYGGYLGGGKRKFDCEL